MLPTYIIKGRKKKSRQKMKLNSDSTNLDMTIISEFAGKSDFNI